MWADPSRYPFEEGHLFLGHIGGMLKGIKTERHAITIAGAGAGKGACVIIPNLLKWPHNALVIDPKGEAAEATALEREKRGQSVYVVDPFQNFSGESRLRASFNFLAELDPSSLTIKEDIEAISDGVIMRADPSASHWDDGAQAILSGLIAYALLKLPPAKQNLIEVRAILRSRDRFAEAVEIMQTLEGCAGLCEAGASAVYAKEGGYFVSNAEKNTRWLDSEGMKNTLDKSTFSLSELKRGAASVYLVLPANYLGQHGRFLRLFVRCAIEEMARRMPSGELRGRQCLFLLDEFFSLGYIDEIAKAAGLMRGYGLQLWPILQDLGQLLTLYGREGSETFFGNADLHQFFGNTDQMTLEYISNRLGVQDVSAVPLPPAPPSSVSMGFGQGLSHLASGSKKGSARLGGAITGGLISLAENKSLALDQARYQDEMNRYQRDMTVVGKPRLSPEQVAHQVQRKDDVVADTFINFLFGSEPLIVAPAPYFRDLAPYRKQLEEIAQNIGEENTRTHGERVIVFSIVGVIVACIAMWLDGKPFSWGTIASGVGILNVVGFWIYWMVNGSLRE